MFQNKKWIVFMCIIFYFVNCSKTFVSNSSMIEYQEYKVFEDKVSITFGINKRFVNYRDSLELVISTSNKTDYSIFVFNKFSEIEISDAWTNEKEFLLIDYGAEYECNMESEVLLREIHPKKRFVLQKKIPISRLIDNGYKGKILLKFNIGFIGNINDVIELKNIGHVNTEILEGKKLKEFVSNTESVSFQDPQLKLSSLVVDRVLIRKSFCSMLCVNILDD